MSRGWEDKPVENNAKKLTVGTNTYSTYGTDIGYSWSFVAVKNEVHYRYEYLQYGSDVGYSWL